MKQTFPIQNLLTWYGSFKRDLPWRRNPNSYKTWISEIMLQQTQVDNVIPYFQNFLKNFPNVEALAKAKEEEVLKHWSGLGYYSRARNLHRSAQIIVQKFNGAIPDQFDTIIQLPGIGPYTAGAILSIAYNQPRTILDGNVRRILSRIYTESDDKRLWEISGQIVQEAYDANLLVSDFNQSLMELGALLCSPKNPECTRCPIQKSCQAHMKNEIELYPKQQKKQTIIRQSYALALLRNGKDKFSSKRKWYVTQKSPFQRWFKKMWGFPMISIPVNKKMISNQSLPGLSKQFSKETQSQVKIQKQVGKFKHSITKHQLTIQVYEGTIKNIRKNNTPNIQWVGRSDVPEVSSSSILRKSLALVSRI